MPNAKSVFPIYQEYVDAVHMALTELRVGAIANPFVAKKLTLSQFESLWIRWGETPNLQESWYKRFTLGYSNEVKAVLQNALAIGDPPNSMREAA